MKNQTKEQGCDICNGACPNCRIELRVEGYNKALQDVEKMIDEFTSESFIENEGLIELETEHLKEIDSKGITFALVSLRALIRMHLNKYSKELKSQLKNLSPHEGIESGKKPLNETSIEADCKQLEGKK